MASRSVSVEAPGPAVRRTTGALVWQVVRRTVSTCFRNRVTGLAAEAGFFALMSLPPLVLGLVGSIGYLRRLLGDQTLAEVRQAIIDFARTGLTSESVQKVIVPTLDDVLQRPRVDVISIGFLLSLWSGSRVLNVYLDTITIMYGLGGRRGIVRTRALSFTLYAVALVLGALVFPLVLAGPQLVSRILPDQFDLIDALYWPIVSLLTIALVTTLYHVAVPVRTRWRRGIPGAVLSLLMWVAGSFVLRAVISASVGGPSIYGPLAAPIVVMTWLYVLALAVLIGAAFNAAVDLTWPTASTQDARAAPAPHADEIPLTPVVPGD